MNDRSRTIFILALNPMRLNTEDRVLLAWSYSKEELEKFVAGEKVETYTESDSDAFNPDQTKNYRKVYRKGGPLEWYNSVDDPVYCGVNNTEGGIMPRNSVDEVVRESTEKTVHNYFNWLNQGRFIPG